MARIEGGPTPLLRGVGTPLLHAMGFHFWLFFSFHIWLFSLIKFLKSSWFCPHISQIFFPHVAFLLHDEQIVQKASSMLRIWFIFRVLLIFGPFFLLLFNFFIFVFLLRMFIPTAQDKTGLDAGLANNEDTWRRGVAPARLQATKRPSYFANMIRWINGPIVIVSNFCWRFFSSLI